ncbi:hypothetical protein D3C80_1815200 [compost metagenome]
MADMYDGTPGRSPGVEQVLDIRFGLRVVATAEFGVFHAFLHVDDQQRGIGLQGVHVVFRMYREQMPDSKPVKADESNRAFK